ncbi:MAG: DUF2851 family protein [Saprospiraceae bacterium]|nr:DUF2851 family protein [Saprospiraceae bacterium]
MKEELLHYVWRMQRFDCTRLLSTQGQKITIIQFGNHNHDAGPDFTHARIQIGDTLWAGHVEMHLKASDWLKHGHQSDPAYHNVILHVVLEEDTPIAHPDGTRIPCLELQSRIPAKVARLYKGLQHNSDWIPCEKLLPRVSDITRQLWLDRLLVERLERRCFRIKEILEENKFDWEACLYHSLARSFGMKVNGDAFEQLAKALPYPIVRKHQHNLLQLEALFFGQAGLLGRTFSETYPLHLQREYQFLAHKFQLAPMAAVYWKFLRMRPANFPSIRIAQLAKLYHQTEHLFSKVLAVKSIKDIENLFDIQLAGYWKEHYLLDKISTPKIKALGKNTIHILTINTLAPILFLYGKEKDLPSFCERALHLLESIPSEANHLITKWENIGFKPANAYQSQALLELHKRYCQPKNCLTCSIGSAILKN